MSNIDDDIFEVAALERDAAQRADFCQHGSFWWYVWKWFERGFAKDLAKLRAKKRRGG